MHFFEVDTNAFTSLVPKSSAAIYFDEGGNKISFFVKCGLCGARTSVRLLSAFIFDISTYA